MTLLTFSVRDVNANIWQKFIMKKLILAIIMENDLNLDKY